MTARSLLIFALSVVALASLLAFKFLWALTAWYEWMALGVFGACLIALRFLVGRKHIDRGGSGARQD